MKYLYVHTWGANYPERSILPFQLATAAAMMDNEATIVFTMTSPQLLKQGAAEAIQPAEGMPNLAHFVELAREAGVKFLVCSGGLDITGLKQEDLIEVDGFMGGVTLNELAAEADVVMTF